MKIRLICIAIFISFSGRANAELELYPDYQKSDASDEDWAKDQALNPNFQPYYENQRQFLFPQDRSGLPYLNALQKFRQADLTWPSVAAENIFKNQQLSRRISELSRKFEEMHRRPQYFFKTHSAHNKLNHYNIFDTIDDKNDPDFLLNYKPNSHILDDVRNRPNDDDSMELSLPVNDDVNFARYVASNEQKHEEPLNEEISKGSYKNEFEDVKVVDDPTEFAYPPSDPRYFEAAPTDRVKTTSLNEKKLEKEESGSSGTSYNEIRNRNNNYRNQQLLPVINNVKHQVVDGSDGSVVAIKPHQDDTTGVYIIAIVAGISAAATVGLIAFGIGWYKFPPPSPKKKTGERRSRRRRRKKQHKS